MTGAARRRVRAMRTAAARAAGAALACACAVGLWCALPAVTPLVEQAYPAAAFAITLAGALSEALAGTMGEASAWATEHAAAAAYLAGAVALSDEDAADTNVAGPAGTSGLTGADPGSL